MRVLHSAVGLGLLVLLAGCDRTGTSPTGPDADTRRPDAAVANVRLVEQGRRLFFEETFGGNGRTCGTCHPMPSLALSPGAIAALPPDDPFFAASMDFDPEMARRGLMRYPLGGASLFEPALTVFRAIPSIRNLRRTAPYTADGRAATLQVQAVEAALVHLLDGGADRPGERLPSSEEIDAIVAFELSMSETALRDQGAVGGDPLVQEGRRIFFGKGACTACHLPPLFTDNGFHNIVAVRPGAAVTDPGRCRLDPTANDCASGASFNTPQLRDLAATAPYFHDNSLATLAAVVRFYSSPRFSGSPAALRLGIGPLHLSEEEQAALVRYLETL
jgi:cytochrome c peroxidase